jgi:hypothetical protein
MQRVFGRPPIVQCANGNHTVSVKYVRQVQWKCPDDLLVMTSS